jgi:hypothetical protein
LLATDKGLEGRGQWQVVYRLSNELARNPSRVELTQRLTLDKTQPAMGLKGSQGLFGSEHWWQSINSGRIPLLLKTGTISRLGSAGMDSHGKINSCTIAGDDGATFYESIYVDRPAHHSRYQVGMRVAYLYALDEWKDPAALRATPEGGILLEVGLSKAR